MSATILTVIVLIVMWVVVLVPLLVRRAEDSEDAALWAPAVAGAALPAERIAGDLDGTNELVGDVDTAWLEGEPERADAVRASGEVCAAASPARTTGSGEVWAAAGSDRAARVAADRDAAGSGAYEGAGFGRAAYEGAGERAGSGRAGYESAGEQFLAEPDRPRGTLERRRPAVPAVLARRRRALAILVLLASATAGAATVASPILWLANVVSDVLLLGYLTRLRAGARKAHRARQESARHDTRPARQGPAAPAYRPAPVTRRPSQVIGLDDEDPSFAQLEMRYPRAANE